MIRKETKYIYEIIENNDVICSLEVTDKNDYVDWELHPVVGKIINQDDCDIRVFAKMVNEATQLVDDLESGAKLIRR